MSYPAPRYHGETGEVSATFRSVDAAPEFVNASGTRIHYLATGASSDGEFGLYRYEMGLGPAAPAALPPHHLRVVLRPRRYDAALRRRPLGRRHVG